MLKARLAVTALLAAAMIGKVQAATVGLNFSGPGLSGSLILTYGTATDAKYPTAFEVTGISGTFSDSNNGLAILNAPVGPLVAITRDTPEPGNDAAPNDFSRFPVASGLSAQSNGFLTYDNLFWPNGSLQTASDYPPHGGALDIYGLLFSIGSGRVVDLWSDGADATGAVTYGVAVATSATALDYVFQGVSVSVPEPGSLALLGGGLLAMFFRRRHAG